MILRGVITAAVALLFPACAPQETISGAGTAVGTVAVVGNMPFTRLALTVGGSATYLLRCTPALEDSLRGMQGLLVRVRFRGARALPDGTALDVVRVETVQGVENR